jgi:POT family proton-dependent oligopeptide transporter
MSTDTFRRPDDLFGHPRGLFVCFATEMWERFSFYGLKALLVLYLKKHHLFSDADALMLAAAYGALVYAMPLLGGVVSDRYFGQTRSVQVGAMLLVAGHFAMAFEGHQAFLGVDGDVVRDEAAISILYLALALIVVGVGLLKPNISTVVGKLYGDNDPRRDGGFTIFYMGINVGAASAALLCGWLADAYGWSYGFGAAGIGMLLGLLIFNSGQSWLEGKGDAKNPELLNKKTRVSLNLLTLNQTIYAGCLVAVGAVWLMMHLQPSGIEMQGPSVFDFLLALVAIVFIAWFIWLLVTQCDGIERGKMSALFFLIVTSTVFWSMFEQSSGSMTLFADRATDLSLFGLNLTASQFASANPIFIIILSPLFALLWPALLSHNLEPTTPAKFGFGIMQVGLGFGALLIGINNPNAAGLVSAWWLVLAYFLHTSAELCLSPVGLSAVTKLSIARYVGVMMGAWFLASAFGTYLASELAIFFSSVEDSADGRIGLEGFSLLFSELLIYGVVLGAVVLLISPLIRRLMADVR